MSEKPIFSSKNFDIVRQRVQYDYAGNTKMMDIVVQPETVIAVVESNTPGKLILVEHWRPIFEQSLLECPGGKVSLGEDPKQAIARELSQEIGYVPTKLSDLGSFLTSVGTSTERIRCFVAADLTPGERDETDSKRMTIRSLDLDEVRLSLDEGKFQDGKTEIALARYFRLKS